MNRESTLYQGKAFILNENSVYQDSHHWAYVHKDGSVTSMKNKQHHDFPALDVQDHCPHYRGSFATLNRAYDLAAHEARCLLSDTGMFRAGANWPTVWTRDIAYASHLGLALWNVRESMNSLRSRVKDDEIEQDTGTGGSWPISSDRIVWGISAWDIYCLTGDREWLAWSCEVLEKTIRRDEMVLLTHDGLIKGETSYLDWRHQSYPKWMTAADIGDSVALSTMLLHAESRKVLACMLQELGFCAEAESWSQRGQELFGLIEKNFRLPNSELYGQYLYGRAYPVLSDKIDSLGNLLTILTGHIKGKRAIRLLNDLPHGEFGLPCFYPQMDTSVPAYHNRAIWPFVEAYYTQAASLAGHEKALSVSLACQVRAALLLGTNKENLLLETGLDDELILSSNSQLWSISGMLGSFYKGLFGIRLDAHAVRFSPCVPKSFAGKHTLSGIRYHNACITIQLNGSGTDIVTCAVNGKNAPAFLSDDQEGNFFIELELRHKSEAVGQSIHFVDSGKNPDTPEWSYQTEVIGWNPIKEAVVYRIFRNGVFLEETKECFLPSSCALTPAHYQVMAVTADGRESYLSEPYSTDPCSFKTRPYPDTEEDWSSARDFSSSASFREVDIPQAGIYRIDAYFANGTYDVSDGNTCALRSLFLNDRRVGALAFPHTSHTDNWDLFMYSTSVTVSLPAGPCRAELRYDEYSENMNRFVNQMVIRSLRFTQIH